MMLITDLPRFTLKKPFSVIIEDLSDDIGGNFLIRVDGANINASGDTPEEAIENLKDIICGGGEHILAMPGMRLAKPLQHTKRWLEEHLGEAT